MQFIDLKTQYVRIQKDVQSKINAVLEHGQYIMGPEVAMLEEQLANYVGVKNCISLASGTDALLIALMALSIGPGDEVITTPFTFFATAETIMLLGAKPVFVDVDAKTYNIDPAKIASAISPKTKAIIPVGMYGQCADMDAITAIASKYSLPVIEDAAQSFGATYKGKKSCALSTVACTSFFPSKPLGAYGDGGACFTNDDELAIKIRRIRIHGQDKRYHHSCIGVNGRLDTIQAAILLAKLPIFEEELLDRSQIGARYTELLQDVVITPYIEPYNTSVYAQYTIQTAYRDKIINYLSQHGIPTAIHYPVPLHLQPALALYQQGEGSFPVAERLAKSVVSLPMHPYLSHEDIRLITQLIKDVIN